jgi:hypothetical protein
MGSSNCALSLTQFRAYYHLLRSSRSCIMRPLECHALKIGIDRADRIVLLYLHVLSVNAAP